MGEFTYDYPRPAVTVDFVVFAVEGKSVRVLLVRRKKKPYAGRWAIPGGFINMGEPFEKAARRELKEETGLSVTRPIAFLGVFGRPGRDPRGRTISVAHAAVIRPPFPAIKGGDDAAEAAWVALDEVGKLAFDHDEILASAREWLDGPGAVGEGGPTSYAYPFGSP